MCPPSPRPSPRGLVVFDCDGVLVDSEPLSNRALADCMTALGHPIEPEECIRLFRGRSWKSCEQVMRTALGWEPHPRLHQDYKDAMYARFRESLEPVAGIRAVLEGLRDEGRPFCVASSAGHQKIRFSLGHCGLREFFDDERIFSAHDVEHGKPAPDLFLHAARALGAAPEDCTVVEDAAPGVAAGKAAGMWTLGFAERTEPELLEPADVVFTSMRELPGLLAGARA